ncbi:MAG: sugar phosphate isomerase/epimerase family protein, partial [Chloroflexota bacterium]
LHGPGAGPGPPGLPPDQPGAARMARPMQLALSGRIAEPEHAKHVVAADFAQLAGLAARTGYRALCVRPAQATTDTPLGRLRAMRAALDRHGLVASMVTPDVRVARQAAAPDANALLRAIGPTLDVAQVLGTALVRVALMNEAGVVWAQRAADEARERGVRLVHQTHTATPFETIDGCREMLARIKRPNFGLGVEPANLILGGQDFGVEALQPLGPYIFNVYVQNVRLTPAGPLSVATNAGPVRYERLVVGDPGGIELPRFFDALKSLGYRGFVTSHQPAVDGIATEALARRVYEALARWTG